MHKPENKLGIAAWLLISIPLSAFVWGFLIFPVPFMSAFWVDTQTQAVYSVRDVSIVGANITARHLYYRNIQCRVLRFSAGSSGFTVTQIDVNVPKQWPAFVERRIRSGCTSYMRQEFNHFLVNVMLRQEHD